MTNTTGSITKHSLTEASDYLQGCCRWGWL